MWLEDRQSQLTGSRACVIPPWPLPQRRLPPPRPQQGCPGLSKFLLPDLLLPEVGQTRLCPTYYRRLPFLSRL